MEEICQTKFNDLTLKMISTYEREIYSTIMSIYMRQGLLTLLKSCFYRKTDEHIDLNERDLIRKRDLISINTSLSCQR